MLKKIVLFMTVLLIMNVIHGTVHGYGWGYKHNNENKLPDVGKYQEIIKGYDAFYADFTDKKEIYLTFDNGYEQGYTKKVLDILKRHQVPATFFVTGHYVKSEPDIVKQIVEEGHIIGNHSYHHPDFTSMTKDEMKNELDMLEKAVSNVSDQKRTIYLRPPRGTFNENTLKWGTELGYIHVFWSLAFKDWDTNNQKGWKYAYDQIVNQIHPGAIILLHAVSKDNVEALEKVIIHLKEQGYLFKSLDDLMVKHIIPEGILF